MKKGFTLIELLVVISIIGILAALTLTGFNAARKNARDAQRKSDLGQYRVALEAYASNNNGKYPNEQGSSCGGDGIFSQSGSLIGVNKYLPSKIPDPIEDSTVSPQRCYWLRMNPDSLTWKLVTNLETGDSWEVCSNGKSGKLNGPNMLTGNCDIP